MLLNVINLLVFVDRQQIWIPQDRRLRVHQYPQLNFADMETIALGQVVDLNTALIV